MASFREFLTEYVANTFKIVVQLGSICAVVFVFKKRFQELLSTFMYSHSKQVKGLKVSHIAIGLLPAVILGFSFENFIDTYLFSVSTVVIGLILGSLLMVAADRWRLKAPVTLTVDDITYRQAFTVGLIQCFSLWPGFSRSGATISGGFYWV